MAKKISEKELINMDEVEEMVGVKNKCFKRFTLSAFKEWVKKIVNKRYDELTSDFWAGKNLYKGGGVSNGNTFTFGDITNALTPFVGSPVTLSFTANTNRFPNHSEEARIGCNQGNGIALFGEKFISLTTTPQKFEFKTYVVLYTEFQNLGNETSVVLGIDNGMNSISVSNIRLELGH